VRLSELRNLRLKSEEWLAAVGIPDAETLAEVGAVEAYRRLQDAAIPGLSLNALWAMDAALADLGWRELTPERKQQLLAELE